MLAPSISHHDNALIGERWLVPLRVLWIVIVVASAAAVALSLPAYLNQQSQLRGVALENAFAVSWPSGQALHAELVNLGISVQVYSGTRHIAYALIIIGFTTVGLLIFIRRSNEWIGWFTSLFLVLFGMWFTYVPTAPGFENSEWLIVDRLGKGLIWSCFYVFLFIFPNGRPTPKWMRFVAIGVAVTVPVFVMIPGFVRTPLALPVIMIWFFLGLYSQIFRYLRFSGVIERLQTRWVTASMICILFAIFVIAFALPVLFPAMKEPGPQMLVHHLLSQGLSSLLLLIPLALGIAIFRYRLWNIDLIIRRTVMYTVITALLAGVYFGTVTLLQSAFSGLIGSESPLAIVISTLAIAALFTPIRRRVQDVVDRRFNRSRYNAEQTLESFAEAMRDEVDLDHLSEALVGVVEETMQPDSVGLWLATSTRFDEKKEAIGP